MSGLACSVSLASADRWDEMVAACPSATFNQTREWAEAFVEAVPGAAAAARFYQFDDGVEAILPGTVETAVKGAVKEFKSVSPSECAGVLSTTRLTPEHAQAIADDLTHAGYGVVLIYENPFDIQPAMPGFSELDEFVQAIPVETEVGFPERVTAKERQKLNKGLRHDFAFERHTGGDGVDEMYAMYLRSAERWGDSTTWLRPLDLVRAVCSKSESAVVRLAKLDGVVVGATVEYHFGRVSQLAMRGFDYEYRNCYPNLVLLGEAYREAALRGADFLDMGGSAGLEGLVESKERVGCVRLGCRVWTWEHPIHRLYSSGRRRIDRAATAIRAAAH